MAKLYGEPAFSLLYDMADKEYKEKNKSFLSRRTKFTSDTESRAGCLGCSFGCLLPLLGFFVIFPLIADQPKYQLLSGLVVIASLLSPVFGFKTFFSSVDSKVDKFDQKAKERGEHIPFDTIFTEVMRQTADSEDYEEEGREEPEMLRKYPGKVKGVLAEVETALQLAKLSDDYEVVNDLVITEPGDKNRILANIDHYVMSAHGSVMVDSKAWSNRPIFEILEDSTAVRLMDKKSTSAITTCAWEREQSGLKPAGLIIAVAGDYADHLQKIGMTHLVVEEVLNPRTAEIERVKDLGFVRVIVCPFTEVNAAVEQIMVLGRDYLEFPKETGAGIVKSPLVCLSVDPAIDLSASVTTGQLKQEEEAARRRRQTLATAAIMAGTAYGMKKFRDR